MKVALAELVLRCRWNLEDSLDIRFPSIPGFVPKNLWIMFEEME
jgi:hypothetical protein